MGYIKRKCNNCGNEYYVCPACERSGSWKIVCCSRNCFREYIKKEIKKENKDTEIIETQTDSLESKEVKKDVTVEEKTETVIKKRKYTRKNGE